LKKRDYDVIVVGCGPGGAAAGNFAALNGMKTLVVEQKREIGVPITDLIAVIYSVGEIEEAAGLKIDRSWINTLIAGVRYFSASGKSGETRLWPDGISIRRSAFDRGSAENAIRNGAEIWVDTRFVDLIKDKNGAVTGVKVLRGGRPMELSCSVVIGADGTYANVARLAGIPLPGDALVGFGHTLVAVYPDQPLLPPTYEVHTVPEIAPGHFAWVVPMAKGKYVVGIDYCPTMLKEDVTCRQLWWRFVKHLEDIGRYKFDKAGMLDMCCGGTILFHEAPKKIVGDGVMLIGDAAWRPLFRTEYGAGGQHHAIRTGRWAAEVAAQAIKDGDVSEKSLSRYPQRCIDSLKGMEGAIETGRELYYKYVGMSPEMREKAIVEIGQHIGGLHLLMRGSSRAMDVIQPVTEWFKKENLWQK